MNNWDFSSRWILSPPASTWEGFLWNSRNLRSWWIGGGKYRHYFFKRTSERKTVAPMKQCCSVAQSCLTLQPCGLQHARLPSPSPSSRSLLKLMSVESMMPCNHLIMCCSLLLPSIFPSIRVFSIESTLGMRWPKYWSFSISISPSNEYSGLISDLILRIDWLDLLAVQGTLKSLLQHQQNKWSDIIERNYYTIAPSLYNWLVSFLFACLMAKNTVVSIWWFL